MRRFILMIFVAVGLLATFTSCTKEESTTLAPTVSAVDPLDPEGFGYYDIGDGELYYYNEKVRTYAQVKEAYLKLKPLRLEKYKHGELLDSVCNKEIAFIFENKGRLSKDKSKLWGIRPQTVDPYPPFVTVNTDWTFTIKMSKMVLAVGFEFNSLYKGTMTGVTIEYVNTELNMVFPPTFTYPLVPPGGVYAPTLGETGGALLSATVSDVTPFNEIRIRFGFVSGDDPPPVQRYDLMLAGFRYRLAE